MTQLGDEMRLKYIEKERKTLLSRIRADQDRVMELNMERQNIIMSREE